MLARAIEEVATAALEDVALMRTLKLREDARDWVEIDPGYRRISVLARPDAVFVDGAIKYVEYNSDSPAMMAFSDHVGDALAQLPHLAPHAARLGREHMLPRLFETLLACYREHGGAGSPTIAIVDWPGQKTRFEHARIAEYFEAHGCPTVVCDPRALTRSGPGHGAGKKLALDGRAIDLVYRRALFVELLEQKDAVAPLIAAYRDGAVCMVNPLRSYLASSKTLLAFLCERWRPEHGACPVMATRILDAERIAVLRQAPSLSPSPLDMPTVLKKGESHGGLHVILPGIATEAQRQAALDEAARGPWPWIEQAYAPLPRLRIPTAADPFAEKFFNWNPFLFDGRYVGGIARASDTPLINITLGGGLMPTFRTT